MLYRYLFLSPVPPSYQPDPVALPATTHAVRYVAFDDDRPDVAALPDWIGQLPTDRPLVYATLGTAYNRTPDVFPAILAALRDLPVEAIVTVGEQDAGYFGPQPPHIHLARYIPQSLLFPRCDLVITHGGFGTVLTALDHGLPLVIAPIAADQPDHARRCIELGVARAISPRDRTPTAFRDADRSVLNDGRYRRNAERLRDEMHAQPGSEYAVRLLERLTAARQPLIPASERT